MYFFLCKQAIDWQAAEASLEVNRTVDAIEWAKPGYINGMKMLHEFCYKRLKNYSKKRNDPLGDGVSNLSPWFHFGSFFYYLTYFSM